MSATAMTTPPSPQPTSQPRTPVLHRAIGWAAAAGVLPYLTLKALWLARTDVGVADPAMLTDPTMIAGNATTAVLDVLVVVLALALTHGWGYRLPAWLLLLPAWVGTGLLVPIALVNLPATLVSAGVGVGLGDGSLAPWVGPLVYGGFAWQGAFLVAAFGLHARTRWSGVLSAPRAGVRAHPLLPLLAAGGAGTAVLAAGLHLATASTADDVATTLVHAPAAAFAVLGAAGVLALLSGPPAARAAAAVAAWTGSAVTFSWGLYHMALVVGVDAYRGGSGLPGAAHLTGLLAGFALAVAGLLALLDQPRRDR
ncbi:hypothetical protein [Pseudonocardia humida]|uniref:Acyltransferase n=1 Tax=Pseudonocardia humida TaxID=2800819 RepID=A0ABT1A080_9PSEU|nr:hypothetical protein [Pseudonocardia humida]MCO1656407.1 hypothetical protein [Pseudonocardia humida]